MRLPSKTTKAVSSTLGACLLLAVGSSGGCQPTKSAAAPAAAPLPPVRTAVLVAEEVPLFNEYIGTVRSRDASDLQAQVTGQLTEILVHAGDAVEQGQVLMRIDQSRQAASVSRTEAALASAQSDLAKARADLAALEADEHAARSREEFAQRQWQRLRALFGADHASRQEYERATAEKDRTAAEHAAVRAQSEAQRAAITGLQALVSQSQSALKEGEAELAYYNITAPIAGRLGDVPVRVGDLVGPQTLLTSLEGNASREIYVQVPVDQQTQLHPGLTVLAMGRQGHTLAEAKVDFVAPQVDPVTQTLLIKAPLDTQSPLTPGQYVRVRVIWDHKQGPTVPPAAVLRVNTQPFLFVVQPGSPPTVQQQPVQLGPLQEQRYLVESGVAAGQEVVVAGIQRLHDGSAIAIESAQQSAANVDSPARAE